jgi:Glycosyl hydrolase family 65 central catalytic domain
MFPWRAISGEETSAYCAAGTAQYHINADIMYALRKYVQATSDEHSCGTAAPRCSWKRHGSGWTWAFTRLQKGEIVY